MNQEIAKRVAKILLDIKAVKLNPTSPFKYASGILSPVYTDCRMLISFPKERKEVVGYLVDTIKHASIKTDVIAGTATAGIPHAAWVADAMDLPMIYVRSKPKDHGTGSLVEGFLEKGQETVVIEDLISTGGSSSKTVQAIRDEGGKASHVFAIITYGMQKANKAFAFQHVGLTTLTNFQTVVDIAVSEKLVKPQEHELILAWTRNPTGWAKKQGFE